jgi:hypothetical protein
MKMLLNRLLATPNNYIARFIYIENLKPNFVFKVLNENKFQQFTLFFHGQPPRVKARASWEVTDLLTGRLVSPHCAEPT